MSIRRYYVYVYYYPSNNEPFYVGKGTGNRLYKHLRETYKNTENKKKWATIKGIRNKNNEPIVKIYKDNLTDEEAQILEKELIKKWGRRDIDENGTLTNICIDANPPTLSGKDNPNYGRTLSEETKRKIAKTKKENPYYHTNEHKQKLSLMFSGKNNPMYGKKHSTETKKNFKKRKLGSGMKGKKHSDETKQKLSKAFNNSRNERIEKIRNSVLAKQGVTYRVVDPQGNEYNIVGIPQFAKKQDLSIASIRAMIHRRKNGHDTKHKGWLIEKIMD